MTKDQRDPYAIDTVYSRYIATDCDRYEYDVGFGLDGVCGFTTDDLNAACRWLDERIGTNKNRGGGIFDCQERRFVVFRPIPERK